MKRIQRKHPLPSIFCIFPWVRPSGWGFVDVNTPADQQMVSLWQRLRAGTADVSELDTISSLALAVDVPDKVSAGYLRVYQWDLCDVRYLLEGNRPAEALPISEAGFTQEQLVLLAKDDRYLKYVRALEKHDGKRKGHYFPIELEEKLEDMERRAAASGVLKKMLAGLRVSQDGRSSVSPIPKIAGSLRNDVLQFHGYRCIFDGRSRPEFEMHVHHVIPQRLIQRLGLPSRLYTARENLVCACSGCNIVKSDELTQADARFYLVQFADSNHPNHPLVKFLERIQELQQQT